MPRSSRRLVQALAGLVALVSLMSCSGSDRGSPDGTPAGTPAHSSSPLQQPGLSQAGLRLADSVTGQHLGEQLRDLERLTLTAGGHRGPGSAGFEAVAAWVEQQLDDTGFYDVYREPFTIQVPHPGESTMIDDSGAVVNQVPLSFSPGTGADGLTGRLVLPAEGDGCRATDWGAEVAAQIGLVKRGGCSFRQLNEVAAAAGAAALVVSNDRPGGLYGTLDHTGPGDIPMTGVTLTQGDRLRSALGSGQLVLSFTFEQRIESFETFNLFAETRSGNPGNVVMAGAHLDSVPEGPGVNDNGSGSVILLETALQLAAQPQPPSQRVRFAWWSGEELGLLGSLHWVNSAVADDPNRIRQLAAYLNVDMVASPNYVIGVYGPGDDAPMLGLLTGYFDAIGQPWIGTDMTGASDHEAFLPSGVPVSGLFTGAGQDKSAQETAIFGGTRGADHDPNYHRASDTFANLSEQALAINAKASAYVIGALADDTSPVNGGRLGNAGTPRPATGFGYAGTI